MPPVQYLRRGGLVDKPTDPTNIRARRGAALEEEIETVRSPDAAPLDAKPDRRQERGRRRHQAFIDAARDLFISQGYRGTTLEAIIARAGGSRETLYRMYGGKKGLFSALIGQVGEDFARSIMAPSALNLPPREGLARLSRQLIEVWKSQEGRAVNHVVLSEGMDAPELVDAWYAGGTELSIIALARYLEAQSEAGRLGPLDAPLVARQFLTLLMGEMAFPFISRGDVPVDPTAQIDRCVELILRAYQPPNSATA